MIGKYKIITLCGSTKFKDEFIAEQKRLTLEGNIVISVGLFGHSGDNEVLGSGNQTDALMICIKGKLICQMKFLLLIKADILAHQPVSEIEHALGTGKPVKYLF